MFPELNLDIVEEIKNESENDIKQGVTYLYDFKEGDFILKNGKPVEADGVEGVKVWIEKILLTEEFVYSIYSEEGEEYGTTIRKLILGKKIPELLLYSELKRIISGKVKQHIEIDRIEGFEIKQELVTLFIIFTVILKNGVSFRQEVSF